MTSDLESRIKRHVRMNGPLPLAEYMHWCLSDPKAGYYTNRKMIGKDGDFVTAPEISQMFGELIGIWIYKTWQDLGSPSPFNLIEIGPGNGTLMRDILRATGKLPRFLQAARINLVETSPALKTAQKDTLKQYRNINWCEAPHNVSGAPCLIIANELLDAMPVRQYIKVAGQWHERCIALGDDDRLCWVLGTGTIAPALLPKGHEDETDGSVFETSPSREAYVYSICELLKKNRGAALFFDYGHTHCGFGDTFQAIREHRYADPLDRPGQCDLTSHVDFGSLRRIASDMELFCPPVLDQGSFLLKAGLLERAGELGRGKDEGTQAMLTKQAERLALPDQMGELFKAMAIGSLQELWLFDKQG